MFHNSKIAYQEVGINPRHCRIYTTIVNRFDFIFVVQIKLGTPFNYKNYGKERFYKSTCE